MIPQRFAGANTVMTRPKEMTEQECVDVHAFADGQHVITCWRPTPEELVKLNLGEPVWLWIIGRTMPPVLHVLSDGDRAVELSGDVEEGRSVSAKRFNHGLHG